MLLTSVLNRSKNSESIIGGVSDSIIDSKSIFGSDLSKSITCNVAVILSQIFSMILRGHPGVQKHCRATSTILAIQMCYVGKRKPLAYGTMD